MTGAEQEKATYLWVTRGLESVSVDEVSAGDIVTIAGPDTINIGDTIAHPELKDRALPPLDDEVAKAEHEHHPVEVHDHDEDPLEPSVARGPPAVDRKPRGPRSPRVRCRHRQALRYAACRQGRFLIRERFTAARIPTANHLP